MPATCPPLACCRQRGQRAREVSGCGRMLLYPHWCGGALHRMPASSSSTTMLSNHVLSSLPAACPRHRWYYRAGLVFWPTRKRLATTVRADPPPPGPAPAYHAGEWV